jgi:hypothetical protein
MRKKIKINGRIHQIKMKKCSKNYFVNYRDRDLRTRLGLGLRLIRRARLSGLQRGLLSRDVERELRRLSRDAECRSS